MFNGANFLKTGGALLLAVMVFGFAGTAEAQKKITFIANQADNTQPWVDFAMALYGPDTIVQVMGWGNLNNSTNRADLNAQDLVVVLRRTDSGNYDDNQAEIDEWNNLPIPLMLQSAFLSRNSHWDWVDDANAAPNDIDTIIVSDATDPIFAGMGLSNGDPVQIFNTPHAVDTNNTLDMGNGTLTAQLPGLNRFAITRWTAPVTAEVYHPNLAVTHVAERLFFACPEDDAVIGYLEDATPLGRQLMVNAFDSLLPVPPPLSGMVSRTLPHTGLYVNAATLPVRLTATPFNGGQLLATETLPVG